MRETKKETTEDVTRTYDERLNKQNELDERIKDIFHRVKVLAEAGWTVVGSNRIERITIIPLCWAIKNDLAEIENLVLENESVTGVSDLPEQIRKLRSV